MNYTQMITYSQQWGIKEKDVHLTLNTHVFLVKDEGLDIHTHPFSNGSKIIHSYLPIFQEI